MWIYTNLSMTRTPYQNMQKPKLIYIRGVWLIMPLVFSCITTFIKNFIGYFKIYLCHKLLTWILLWSKVCHTGLTCMASGFHMSDHWDSHGLHHMIHICTGNAISGSSVVGRDSWWRMPSTGRLTTPDAIYYLFAVTEASWFESYVCRWNSFNSTGVICRHVL